MDEHNDEDEFTDLGDGFSINITYLQTIADRMAAPWLRLADVLEEARIAFEEFNEIAECYGITVDEL